LSSTTSRYIILEIGKKDIKPLIDEKKGKKGKRAARLLVFFHHRDLAGDRFLLRKELAGGRRPPDLGETRPSWEFVREEQEHGIVAAAARSVGAKHGEGSCPGRNLLVSKGGSRRRPIFAAEGAHRRPAAIGSRGS